MTLTEELEDTADEGNGHEGTHAQKPVGRERQTENELHAQVHVDEE